VEPLPTCERHSTAQAARRQPAHMNSTVTRFVHNLKILNENSLHHDTRTSQEIMTRQRPSLGQKRLCVDASPKGTTNGRDSPPPIPATFRSNLPVTVHPHPPKPPHPTSHILHPTWSDWRWPREGTTSAASQAESLAGCGAQRGSKVGDLRRSVPARHSDADGRLGCLLDKGGRVAHRHGYPRVG
jgi:hypothetical protein